MEFNTSTIFGDLPQLNVLYCTRNTTNNIMDTIVECMSILNYIDRYNGMNIEEGNNGDYDVPSSN